jgi:thiol-disulfide isomerase/thioredoxin
MTSWTGVAVGVALAIAIAFPASGAAVAAGCDPKAKSANLKFSLKDIEGKDVALSSYKGKVILLDFWATWCAPCKVEIPWFVEFHKKYGPQGFVVIGVSIDDPVSKLKPFVTQYKMNYPVLIGDARDDVKDAYGPLVGFPTSVLIARDGTICRTHIGYAPKEQFERDIKALLPAS